MAEFAKAQLLKYGWTEGKGLGKNETGVTEAIKPKLKFDSAGVGFKDTDYKNDWWETAFNKAASSITINTQSNGVSISVSDANESSKKISKKNNTPSTYGNFLKTSTLFGNEIVQENNVEEKPESSIVHVPLTDEELFKACGGRTAHKGARHGITLSGRFKRIAQQDKEILSSSTFAQPSKKFRTQEREILDFECGTDSNANTIVPLPLPPFEDPVSPKLSKCNRKEYKRRMHDLIRQLNTACNMDCNDDEETNSSNNTTTKKKSELKRKLKKDKRKGKLRSNSADGIPREATDKAICDVPLPASEDEGANRRRRIHGKGALNGLTETAQQGQASSVIESDQGYSSKKKKSKRKRSRNCHDSTCMQADGAAPTSCSNKKKKKNLDGPTIISDVLTELRIQYLKDVARMNHRICKKKRTHIRAKRRVKLQSITDSLSALHFDTDQPNKTSSAQKKLETIVEDLMAVNITENKTEEMKKISKKKKKSHRNKE